MGRNTAGKYISGKEQKDLVKADFYQFQKRLVQKDKIAELREGFEADKKRMQKMMDKAARRDQKLAKQ